MDRAARNVDVIRPGAPIELWGNALDCYSRKVNRNNQLLSGQDEVDPAETNKGIRLPMRCYLPSSAIEHPRIPEEHSTIYRQLVIEPFLARARI